MNGIWIRSQNRSALCLCSTLCVDGLYQSTSLVPCGWIITGANSPLGKYPTEARALEVLDEIADCLQTSSVFSDKPDAYYDNVYHMPKE